MDSTNPNDNAKIWETVNRSSGCNERRYENNGRKKLKRVYVNLLGYAIDVQEF